MLNKQQLLQILPNCAKPDEYLPWLNIALQEAQCITPLRIAMFLAQTGYESVSFHYLRELNPPVEKYVDRMGNKTLEDAENYIGRGILQVTGRNNYSACGDYLGIDLLSHPELLETPEYAFRSAEWFWLVNDLNHFADVGDIKGATKVINGGYNGLQDRQDIYDRATGILK